MTLECVQLTIKAEQDRHTQCTLHRAFSEPSSGLSGQVRTAQHDYPHPVTVPVLCFSSKGTWMVPRRRCHPWRSQQKPCPGSPKIPCYLSGELWLVVAGSCLAVVARHVELPYPGGLGVGVGGCQALWSQTRQSLQCVWTLSQLLTRESSDHSPASRPCLSLKGKPRPWPHLPPFSP